MSRFSAKKSAMNDRKNDTNIDRQMILSTSSHKPSMFQGPGIFPGLGFGAGFGPGLGFGFPPGIGCEGFADRVEERQSRLMKSTSQGWSGLDLARSGGVFDDGGKGRWNAQVSIQVFGDVKIYTSHSDYKYDNDDQDQVKSHKRITNRKEALKEEQEKETCGVCLEQYETAKTSGKGARAKRGRMYEIKTPRCCGKKNAICGACIDQVNGKCPFCRGKLKF